jgi:hypothetical protein
MAAAAAQITRPATPAWFLTVYMTLREPLRLSLSIDTIVQRAHGAGFVSDEAMARRQLAIGRNTQVTGPCAARVRPMRPALDLAHGVNHVSEWIALPFECVPLELPPAVNHLAEHCFEILTLHLAVAARRAQHWRKSNAVETKFDELVECAA